QMSITRSLEPIPAYDGLGGYSKLTYHPRNFPLPGLQPRFTLLQRSGRWKNSLCGASEDSTARACRDRRPSNLRSSRVSDSVPGIPRVDARVETVPSGTQLTNSSWVLATTRWGTALH